MPEFPETRPSLLARVKDPRDAEAWARFVAVYRPVIYRLARRRGLQHSDAEDLVQQVLWAVAGAVDRFQPDPQRGRFQSWLRRIARNAITNALVRGRGDRGIGGSDLVALLDEQPDPHPAKPSPTDEEIEQEYRRSVLRWAQQQIRDEFRESTWAAFRRTAIEGEPIEAAAAALGKSVGSVYAARSRIMRRLREVVQQYEEP